MGPAVLVRTSVPANRFAPAIVILSAQTTSIGRRGDVRMDTPSGRQVSKLHLLIHRRLRNGMEFWAIEDNHSVNGTFVNSRKVTVQTLVPGDEIVIGGGPSFKTGDVLQSTDSAFCRYCFYPIDPIVRFTAKVDPNASIRDNESGDICSICYQSVVAPELLPCGHRFCLDCIQQWAETCRKNCRCALCPMCRATFLQSQITPAEATLLGDEMHVWSVDAMLKDLRVRSCRVVKGANIFKKWTRNHKKWFWCALNCVAQRRPRRILFLHLTKATAAHVIAASQEELQQAMLNFEISEISQDPDVNATKVLLFILTKMYCKAGEIVC
jgi:hypothetical protein